MMKKFGLILILTGICLAVAAVAAPLNIATVDLATVFDRYGKTKTAELALKDEEEKVREERQRLLEKAKSLETEYMQLREEAQSPLLSADARDKKRKTAEDKMMEAREYESKVRRLLEMRDKQLTEQLMRSRKMIVDEIKEKVADFALRSGYDLILDSSGQTMNGISIVVFAGPGVDVTEDVIEMINLPAIKSGTAK